MRGRWFLCCEPEEAQEKRKERRRSFLHEVRKDEAAAAMGIVMTCRGDSDSCGGCAVFGIGEGNARRRAHTGRMCAMDWCCMWKYYGGEGA